MKKVLLSAACLMLALALSGAATLAGSAADGWKSVPREAAGLPADAQTAFDTAVGGRSDAAYVPVALLSTRGTAEADYCILCQATPASGEGESG